MSTQIQVTEEEYNALLSKLHLFAMRKRSYMIIIGSLVYSSSLFIVKNLVYIEDPKLLHFLSFFSCLTLLGLIDAFGRDKRRTQVNVLVKGGSSYSEIVEKMKLNVKLPS